MENNNKIQGTLSQSSKLSTTPPTISPNQKISAIDFEQLANTLLETGNEVRFRASGRSMYPFIKDGDTITITPTNTKDLEKGNIAFYRNKENKPTAHRIVGITKEYNKTIFLIRGDGYVAGNERIPAENIMGIVTKVERDGIEVKLDNTSNKLSAAIWSEIQTIRWFLYCVRRKLRKNSSNNLFSN